MQNTQLPIFPEFVALGPHHQAQLIEAIRSNHLYSDYNFVSLWSWDHQNKLRLCTLNDNLVIRFQDYLNPEDYFYSFFGTNKIDETAITLLRHSSEEGKEELKLIPEFVVQNLHQPEAFVVKEDRDSFDYIVAIKDMVDLSDSHDQSRRWSMNKFIKNHSDGLSVKELDIKNGKHAGQMMAVVENWRRQMRSRGSYRESEIEAIKKLINQQRLIKTDNLHIIGLYLDDELKAFSITEILEGGFAMGHYKKSDRTYRGMGVALENFTAKSLGAKGVTHINHQQDLGIAGLRQSKMASRPVYFMKKYTLSLKG